MLSLFNYNKTKANFCKCVYLSVEYFSTLEYLQFLWTCNRFSFLFFKLFSIIIVRRVDRFVEMLVKNAF